MTSFDLHGRTALITGGFSGTATVRVHNQGEAIEPALMERIFEYGVSGGDAEGGSAEAGQRGQGLFVARTYMSKMGGTIEARNEAGGVSLVLTLPRAL